MGAPSSRAPRTAGAPSGLGDRVIMLLASGGGVGLCPWGPGTVGSLLGLCLAWGLHVLGAGGYGPSLATSFGLALAAVPVCSRAARRAGAADPGWVVLDEIAPFPAIFAGLAWSWPTALGGFVLFRVFDILKPGPVRRAERLPGGWGIVADDLVAGLLATAVLRAGLAAAPWAVGGS